MHIPVVHNVNKIVGNFEIIHTIIHILLTQNVRSLNNPPLIHNSVHNLNNDLAFIISYVPIVP